MAQIAEYFYAGIVSSVLSPLIPQYYFLVMFGHDGQKPLELRSEEELDCDDWVDAIQQARYDRLALPALHSSMLPIG